MIIAFAGKKQSGKTSACQFASRLFTDDYYKHRMVIDQSDYYEVVRTYNFADPLKKLCIDILGLTEAQCYGTDENKNEIVNCFWPGIDAQMTAREVMQYIGTDVLRRIQRNVWSDATIRKITKENFPLALIADCRFPNEVAAVKKAGGLVIKLDRSLYSSSHASETALDEASYDQSNFDLIIDNHSLSIEDKNQYIYNFLTEQKVISL